MKESIDLLKDVLEGVSDQIMFYKTFTDWKQVYSKEMLLLEKRRDNFKKAIKVLRGLKK